MSKGTKIISFIGGLVFVSVVATVLILKNDKARNELEAQAKDLLETSKNAIEQVQLVTAKIGSITSGLKSDKQNSILQSMEAPGAASNNQRAALEDGYDSAWRAIEEQQI